MYYFNFTTFERQILYFSLHYISIMVLGVESRYCSFESQRVILFFLVSDSLSVITLVEI